MNRLRIAELLELLGGCPEIFRHLLDEASDLIGTEAEILEN